jgi:hypothetical protein
LRDEGVVTDADTDVDAEEVIDMDVRVRVDDTFISEDDPDLMILLCSVSVPRNVELAMGTAVKPDTYTLPVSELMLIMTMHACMISNSAITRLQLLRSRVATVPPLTVLLLLLMLMRP